MGGWGAAIPPPQHLTNLQETAIIRQKIGIKFGKVFVNNVFLSGAPKILFLPMPMGLGGWSSSDQ